MLYLSVLTVGEIRKGLAGLAQGKRRTHLETWLEVELQAQFSAMQGRQQSYRAVRFSRKA